MAFEPKRVSTTEAEFARICCESDGVKEIVDRSGNLMPRTFLEREAKWFPEGALREIPEDPQPVIGWELEPGDAVFFHALTLHRSAGSAKRRRVVSFRFLGDDATHAPRRWRTSPPFPGLSDELAEGAPMDHPLFPVL
jgi:ectoine hydroxylase-related dioxygenase (phytanoyl-CoA dioxygenase family)